MVELTGKKKQALRAQAHPLAAYVQVGHAGVTEPLIQQVDSSLEHHELLKIRFATEAPEGSSEAAEALAQATRSTVVQIMGRTLVLYRENPKLREKKSPKKPVAKAASGAKPRRLTSLKQRMAEKGVRRGPRR